MKVESALEAVKPMLRGWLHLVCFFLAVPVGIWLVTVAKTPTARVGAAVYAVGLAALFGVSGLYHRGRWGPAWRRRMSRLDHSTIFVMIAGSYTPVCLVALRGRGAAILLTAVWTGALAGAALSWSTRRGSVIACNVLYIVLGWLVVAAGPQLVERVDTVDLVLLAIGGILFTVGAITLATRWPNPFPHVFGYHEVWHVMVVVAAACQLVAIASLVSNAGST